MPSEPVQHDGVWWSQQDDGTWLRWDEATNAWVAHSAAAPPPQAPLGAGSTQPVQPATAQPAPLPAAPAPATPTPVAAASSPRPATPARQAQPVQTGAAKKSPLIPILGVVVLGIVAVAVYALAFAGGGSDDGSSASGGGGSGSNQPQGSAPAQVALETIACEHNGSGKAYEVGPGEALASLGEVPWETLAAGDTVLIHYRAEPYREKFLLRGQGTEAQPIVVCGVAGPNGELPIIDGENAVARRGLPYANSGAGESRGLIHVALGADDQWGYKPQFIVIQGLHIRNAFYENSFTRSNGQRTNYTENAAGIFIERGENITVRGVEIEGNGNGFFVASGDSEEVLSRDILLERSRIFGNGTVKVSNDRYHNIYTEAAGMIFQFNDIGPMRDGSGGAAMKDRSSGSVIRYNRIEGGARTLDLVDAQESFPITAKLPEYSTTLVYGNILINGQVGASNMIHYGGDSSVETIYRKGTLYFYNNTVIVKADASSRSLTSLFDVSTADEKVDARNNVIFVGPATSGAPPTTLAWMRDAGNLELGANVVTPGIKEWRTSAPSKGGIKGLDKLISADEAGFADVAGGDFTLASGSEAVGASENLHDVPLGLGATVDFEYVHPASGQPRDNSSDMGAFAATGAPASSGSSGSSASGSSGNSSSAGSSSSSGSSTSGSSTTGQSKSGATVSGSAKADGWTGPLKYLDKGPNGYDNGQKQACTGAKSGSPSVLCVKAGAGSGGTGTAAAPFATINAAIAAAAQKDIIQVAAGTYTENVAVGAKYGALVQTELTLLGGFSPDFASRDASQFRSLIDGKNAAAPAVQIHLQSNGKTVLDGFRITGGRGLGTNSEDGNGRGGGVFVEILGNGEVLISHNEVFGNRTSKLEDENRGGGISTDGQDYDGTKPTIRIEDNVIHNNQAGRAAGINVAGRQATILRNVVEGNKSHSDHGGGVYISTEAGAEIGDNVIRGNEVGTTVKYGYGGGIIIAAAPADMHGNVVTGNFAPSAGAGVFWDEGAKGTMREDLIFNNGCPNVETSGMALYVDGGSGPSVVTADHVTIAGHSCASISAPAGAAIQVENLSKLTIKNSIIWDNTRDFQLVDKGTFSIENSITTASGKDNKKDDPQFVDPANGNFKLKPGSKAIGAGSSNTNLGAYPK